MRLVRELLRPYRGWLLIIFAAMLLQTLMSLAAPWPLKIVIDNVVGGHKVPEWLAALHISILQGDKLELAAIAAIGMVLIAAVAAVAGYIENYYTESVAQWVAYDLRNRLYDHLQRLSLAYYDSHQLGTILSTVIDDVKTIQAFASSGTLGILVDLLTIVGMLGIMFWLNWDFALIAVAATPFLLLFVARINRVVKRATHEVRKHQSDVMAVVQQGLESARVVQAFGAQATEEAHLKEVSRATVDAALAARRVKSLLSPAVSIAVALCTGFVLYRGTALIMSGAMTRRRADGVPRLPEQVLQAGPGPRQDEQHHRADGGGDRAHPDDPEYRHDRPRAAQCARPGHAQGRDRVRARGVRLRSEGAGAEGREPAHRARTVGGRSRHDRRRQIHRREPDPALLRPQRRQREDRRGRHPRLHAAGAARHASASCCRTPCCSRARCARTSPTGGRRRRRKRSSTRRSAANADEFIARMPNGYDTQVGERGLTMSGGQRQRIGIARAIIRKTPILILDEPTAALDTESEKLVIDALERLMKGRTVITIAHRLSTIRHANKIIVLKDGLVAEQGTHDELLAANGVYAELHRAQVEPRARESLILPSPEPVCPAP